MIVELNRAEWEFATARGKARQSNRTHDGHQNAHEAEGGASLHVWGALGELAYAKLTNQYPSGLFLPMRKDDDVGGTQVRTRTGPKCDFYLWLEDSPDDHFAFLTYEGNHRFRHHGTVLARDYMNDSTFTRAYSLGSFPRVDCFIIPQELLRP